MIRSRHWMTLLATGLISTSLLSTGCSEIVTYSQKSRAQGISLIEKGQTQEAVGAFRDAVRQNSRDYLSFFYLAQCYEKLGQESLAIHNYQTAISVQPATVEGRQDRAFTVRAVDALGSLVARSASREVEIQSLEERARRSQSAIDHFVVAKAYQYSGDADNAIDAYNRATLNAPTDVRIVRAFGLYLESIGQARRAEPVLRRSYQLAPDDGEVYAALRRIGIVPGPALLQQDQLARPAIPRGPLPEVGVSAPGGADDAQTVNTQSSTTP